MSALVAPLLYAASVAATLLGAAVALGAGNVVKRLAGLVLAHIGASVLLAALGSGTLALALIAALAAELGLGAALCARLAEDYATTESDALAKADVADEERA